MRILLVAPSPFFEERGTPIAVRLLCETLCEAGHSVDLLTYHVGTALDVPGLNIIRIPAIPFVREVPIGFSWRKIVCDVILSAMLLGLVARNHYRVIHAIEESVFPALLARCLRPCTVVYDMDSSLPDQLIEKRAGLKVIAPVLYGFERLAIRRADRIVAVCDDLAARARSYDPDKAVTVLRDVPLESGPGAGPVDDLRQMLGIRGMLALYVGNLARYQGIDLMLEGFAFAHPDREVTLVVVGGHEKDIAQYREKAQQLGIADRAYFVGPRPVAQLPELLEQASMLVSPRLLGNNTPMKVYSYLAAGKPLLATRIASHTQVMDSSSAELVEPTPQAMAAGLERLAADEALCRRLGKAAQELARSKYSLTEFKRTVIAEYRLLEPQIT